jgi:hypothetical protein
MYKCDFKAYNSPMLQSTAPLPYLSSNNTNLHIETMLCTAKIVILNLFQDLCSREILSFNSPILIVEEVKPPSGRHPELVSGSAKFASSLAV